jgi:ribonuclease Z
VTAVPATVTLTGTGVPLPAPGRAGPGTLVRHGDVALQFDAGRGTVLRLADAGVVPQDLTALFITHVHSDHVVDLVDVAMTRWIFQHLHPVEPLSIVAPEGPATRFVQRMFDGYEDDVAARRAEVLDEPPTVDLRSFAVTEAPTTVWTSPDGEVTVSAVGVRHEPVVGAVAFRVDTPAGSVVVSGDTRVCDEVEHLAAGADVLVHEACRTAAMSAMIDGTSFEHVFSYHADTHQLGALAERAGVGHLLLTHLIPPPTDELGAAAFADDVRAGGYTGAVTVGEDLLTLTLGEHA